jgi:hypothetical protein
MMGEWLPSDPMAFTDEVFFQRGMPPAGMPRNGAPVSPGNFLGGGGGGGGNNPRPGGGGGGAPAFGFGGGGGGGAATGTSAATSSDSYSRWVYRRDGAKYGFIVDRDNKVVQIEAVALKDPKAVTRKGLTFGATFIKVIKTYGWPESYEVAGNTITMRYLVKNHVIFRLNRLGLDKPHVITGILIAAAKS